MSDPNDPRPVRVMLFPDKPQAILIHVPGGQSLWLPPLATPFDLDAVCGALDDHDVSHVTTEGDAGKWWVNATQQEKEEKAERASQEKQQLAERMVRIKLSPAATTFEKQRAELVLEKQKADDELRRLKLAISKAKSNAYLQGTYLTTRDFREKQQRLADLQMVSLALQARLGELRRQRSEAARDSEESRQRRFIEKAKRYLTRDQYLAIWAEVTAEFGDGGGADSDLAAEFSAPRRDEDGPDRGPRRQS